MSEEIVVLPPFSTEGKTVTAGLTTKGLITIVPITSIGWTPLPATALNNRNAISIQNVSGTEIKVNFVNNVGYVGIVIPDDGERFYNITDDIVIYARAASGSPSITVEEIS